MLQRRPRAFAHPMVEWPTLRLDDLLSALHFVSDFGSISREMATGPFQYDPATREFKRRDSVQHWVVDKDVALMDVAFDDDLPDVSGVDEHREGFVNPAGTRRRRRRSYTAADEHSPKKTKRWRVAMWGLILVLLVGWLVMIAVLTSRSGASLGQDRKFEFDRGEPIGPDSLIPR